MARRINEIVSLGIKYGKFKRTRPGLQIVGESDTAYNQLEEIDKTKKLGTSRFHCLNTLGSDEGELGSND